MPGIAACRLVACFAVGFALAMSPAVWAGAINVRHGIMGSQEVPLTGRPGGMRGQPLAGIVLSGPVYVDGLRHDAMGNAHVEGGDLDGDGVPDLLTVSGIGSSGEDGVAITFSDVSLCGSDASCGHLVRGWSGAIDFGRAGSLERGFSATIRGRYEDGLAGPHIATIREIDGGHAELTLAEACATCSIRFIARRGGSIVADIKLDGSTDVIAIGAIGSGGSAGSEAVTRIAWRYVDSTPSFLTGVIMPVPTTLEFQGVDGIDVLSDIDDVVVVITGFENQFDVRAESMTLLASGMGGTNITITRETVVVGDRELRSRGGAHITGIEVCDGGRDGCPQAIEIANLGRTGMDGIEIRGGVPGDWMLPTMDAATHGYNSQTGRQIWIAAKPLNRGDSITITSAFCPAILQDGGDDVAHDSAWEKCSGGSLNVRLSGSLVSSGDGIQASVDFSMIEAQWMHAQVRSGGQIIGSALLESTAVVHVLPCPGGESVRVVSMTDADHAGGENVPGFVWGFDGDVCVQLNQGLDSVIGNEVVFIPAARDNGGVKIAIKTRKRTSMTGGHGGGDGSATGVIFLTGVDPARMSFGQGHVFGLHHAAVGGASLALVDLSGIDNAPEEKERGLAVSGDSDDDGVDIDVGAGEFAQVRFKAGAELAAQVKMRATTEDGPGALVAVARCNADSCPDARGIEDAAEFMVDLSMFNPSEYQVEMYRNHELAHIVQQAGGVTLFASGSSTTDYEVTLGRNGGEPVCMIRWMEPESLRLSGGPTATGDLVVITALGADPMGAVDKVNISGGGDDPTEPWELVIADEAIGVFGLEHRAGGAGQFGCCADADGDGVPDLVLANPSRGLPATIVSNGLQAAAFGRGQYADDKGWIIPDPCAGLPPDCVPFPDGATLDIREEIETLVWNGGTATTSVTITMPPGGGSAADAMTMEADFDRIAPSTVVAEVLLDGDVVATIADYSRDAVQTYNLMNTWPKSSHAYLDPSMARPKLTHTLKWNEVQSFLIETNAQGAEKTFGDAIRFIAETDIELGQIRRSRASSVNIEEMIFDDLSISEGGTSACPSDLSGDGVVTVADLLVLLGCWGPVAPGCAAADLTGDGAIAVSDLLELLDAWGACPQE